MEDDRRERVRIRAHQIWESEGRPEGMHERHWAQAEKDVDEAGAGTVIQPAKKPAGATAAKSKAKGASPASTEKPKPATKPKVAKAPPGKPGS